MNVSIITTFMVPFELACFEFQQMHKENLYITDGLAKGAFTSFYKSHYASLCFYANRFLKDPALAEDIVADVALKVWQKKDSIEHNAALKSYFYTSIRNTCLSHLSKNHLHIVRDECSENELAEDDKVLTNLIKTEVLHQLHAAVEKLPPQCRRVFTKIYIEGKSTAEAAKEMQLSINTIKKHRERGLIQLRRQLVSVVFSTFVLYVMLWS